MKKDHNDKRNIVCVIPAYNEESVIQNTATEILRFWSSEDQWVNKFQLIIVDDGSSDDTANILKDLQKKHDNLLAVRQVNKGKGAALRNGVMKTSNDVDIIYFIDADLPYNLQDQYRVVNEVSASNPVVYGSRYRNGGFQSNSLKRWFGSKILSILNRMVLQIVIKDTQCGLKAFNGEVAKQVFKRNAVAGFSFDLFNTALLMKWGIPIKTIAIHLANESRESKVNFFKTSFAMLITIFKTKKEIKHIKRPTSLNKFVT